MTRYLIQLLAVAIAGATAPLLAQTYSIKDLGVVSGESVSKAYGLNDLAQAAGVSETPSGAIATLFTEGQALNLGTLEPGDVSIAEGLNKSAEVVGYEPFSSQGIFHAFVYSGGALHDIQSASLFPGGTMAAAINDSGVVVGQGNLNSDSFHAFVYSGGQMVDIGPRGAYQATAVAINNAGQVIGASYPGGAFVFSAGKFTFLKSPSGTTVSANAINSSGQIAGTIYYNSGAASHAGLYSNGAWTDLGGVTGAPVHGTGINNAQQVIATAYFPIQSYHPLRPGKHVGYVARNGQLVDLNTVIPSNSGFTITDAIAINDLGQILCDATAHAVLLTPN